MTTVRLLALGVLYLGTGVVLLHALGLVRGWRSLARFGGLALLVGYALAGTAACNLLVLGRAADVRETIAATAVVLAVLYPAARRFSRPGPPPAQSWLDGSRVAAGACALLVLYAAALLWRSFVSGLTWWDGWAFWVPKALTLVYFDGLDTGAGGFTSFANPDYPPFRPATHALAVHAAGSSDPAVFVVPDWGLAVAFVWALAALLVGRARPGVLWPCLLLLAVVPNLGRLIGAATGDLPLAILFVAGGVAALLWRVEREPAFGFVAATCLAAVPLVKKEGLYLSVAMLVVLALASRGTLRERAAPLALALVPVASVLPWRIWLRANDVPQATDYDPARLVDFDFLAARAGRLADVVRDVPPYFLDPSDWLLALPLALAAAVIARRSAPEAARLVAGMTAVGVLGTVVVYWISYLELDYHLASSAARVPTPVVLLASALLPLLISAADSRGKAFVRIGAASEHPR